MSYHAAPHPKDGRVRSDILLKFLTAWRINSAHHLSYTFEIKLKIHTEIYFKVII
jgi:hypothetical protein